LNRRSLVWVVVALGTLGALFTTPAFADPTPPGGVPDPGVPPVATGPLVPNSTAPASTQTGTPVVGPMAAQILAQRAQVEALGEQVTKLGLDVDAAKQTTEQTRKAWQDAKVQADRLRERADNAAARAYKDATQLGPWGDHANDLSQLDELVPGGLANDPGDGSGTTQSAVIDAATAAALERTAAAAYDAAVATQQRLEGEKTSKTSARAQQAATLADLMARNTQAVAEAEAAQNAVDNQLAGQFAAGSNVNGQAANPIALAAVRAALSKRGSPYVWGTEGPFTFDCSGLVLWSYRQAGFRGLPRVAADQYHATKPVTTDRLLVGDLLFFSTTSRSDWNAISHVGMYLGGDYMVEAPNSGDVVKVAHIWWSAFFGATRVVGAVPAPAPPPPAPTPGTSSPPPTGSPTPTRTVPTHPSGPGSSAPPSSAPPSVAPSSSAPAPAPAPAPSSPSPAPNSTPSTPASSSAKP
jgi:cell wall-associated NlpC family hydrolase